MPNRLSEHALPPSRARPNSPGRAVTSSVDESCRKYDDSTEAGVRGRRGRLRKGGWMLALHKETSASSSTLGFKMCRMLRAWPTRCLCRWGLCPRRTVSRGGWKPPRILHVFRVYSIARQMTRSEAHGLRKCRFLYALLHASSADGLWDLCTGAACRVPWLLQGHTYLCGG